MLGQTAASRRNSKDLASDLTFSMTSPGNHDDDAQVTSEFGQILRKLIVQLMGIGGCAAESISQDHFSKG